MTKDEAIHKALKVLNCLNNDRVYETAWVKGAINACEEALEQPNRFEGYTTIEIGQKKPAQESISEEDISLMAWNSCDEDWNSLGSRKCWLDGYEEGAKAMAKDLGIKVTK